MTTLSKKLLAILALSLLFTANANAKNTLGLDETPLLKIINQYWDICEQLNNKQIGRQKANDEVAKMSTRPDLAYITVGACLDSMFTAERNNKREGKGLWDMSRDVKITSIENYKGQGKLIVRYTYYAFQDPNYKKPKGAGKPYIPTYRIDLKYYKAKDGSIYYKII